MRAFSVLLRAVAKGAVAPLVAGSEFRLLIPTRQLKIRLSLVARGGFQCLVTPRPLGSRGLGEAFVAGGSSRERR